MTPTQDVSTNTIMETVPVNLGERSYDIAIGTGLLHAVDRLIKPHLNRSRIIIVSDENVAELYLTQVESTFAENSVQCDTIVLKPGEATKSFTVLEDLLNKLLALDVERGDMLLAFGGGVIGDITGFAAAILRRGVDFIQFPTSLLAQVDSSVGGKTGINTSFGKNLVGAFHQPRLVIADMALLDTLPKREMQAGYAEIVKYGLIDNPDFFNWLEENGTRILNGDRQAQAHAVAESCRAKARIVAEDEKENGKRALLNLGHTFGHALEAEAGYDGSLLHGEAVAIGMVIALQVSAALDIAPPRDKERLVTHLKSVGMKTALADIPLKTSTERLMKHMGQDKKVSDGKMVFILGGIGEARIVKNANLELVETVLHDFSA